MINDLMVHIEEYLVEISTAYLQKYVKFGSFNTLVEVNSVQII